MPDTVLLAFDLLRLEGRDLTGQPYRQRRRLVDGLPFAGPRWQVPEAFGDGPLAGPARRARLLRQNRGRDPKEGIEHV